MNTTSKLPIDVATNGGAVVTPEHVALYQQEGYMILEKVIADDVLTMLREECSYFLGYYDAQMDAAGETTLGLNHRGKRYFISNRYRMSPRLWRFIFGPVMAEITQAALGPDVYLFNEQWVIKGAEQGMKFAWHQDSGYVKQHDDKTRHKPYLTCWCTLDDVSEDNGTVYLLPHSRGGTSHTIFSHTQEAGTNDLIGYTGDDPGIPIIAPAGSIVAFTSYNFHRSGANTTANMRRIYLPQYSSEPILNTAGGRWAMDTPFVRDGKVVYDHASDTAERYGPTPRG
ncbi:MAG: phytanoyl-CoA dioxygenase family protein [Verrucomicrobia bacterium]|nr:phytanoyl-CoA dioxygenase family protein [Verrucomicrobiota bacterium]